MAAIHNVSPSSQEHEHESEPEHETPGYEPEAEHEHEPVENSVIHHDNNNNNERQVIDDSDVDCKEDQKQIKYVIVNNAINTANHYIRQVDEAFWLLCENALSRKVQPLIESIRRDLAKLQTEHDEWGQDEPIET